MKRQLLITFTIMVACFIASAQLSFTGTSSNPYSIKPAASTGLEYLYVIESTDGVTATYQASSPTAIVEWSRFSNLGGAYSQSITPSRDGASYSIALGPDDIGYIVTDNGRQHCFWIVNYANHVMVLNGASVNSTESDCDMTAITIEGSAPAITYYTINGVPQQLSREISVQYNSLEWDDTMGSYSTLEIVKSLDAINGTTVRVQAPLCDTDFTITGDRFMEAWGKPLSTHIDNFIATAIDAHTSATATAHDSDNEISSGDSDALGGSAPCEITFTAVTTDAVAYREWQLSRDSQFDIIDLRYNQDEVTYTFRDSGNTYARFIAANASGDCEYVSDVYTISIGESRLECPNAFSPGASEGVNDEWKVSYKSLVSFECHIFNQWGVELFSTTDPSKGWDGRHGGKLVPAGVYYYIIKARGSDGKNYSLGGDINIIGYRKNNHTTTDSQL